MAILFDRLRNFYTRPSLPHVAFQVSPGFLSGISISPREMKIKHRFISPLKEGVVQPSFNRKNIADGAYLGEKIQEGARRLHLSRQSIAFLIPESSLKIFVFAYKSLPASQREREDLVRWQVKKQMPILPEDIRTSFVVIRSNEQEKILVALARSAVVQEYEEFFTKAGLKVGTVGVATLSLFNLLNSKQTGNSMIINLEGDSISLLAVLDSEIVLYRIKPFAFEDTSEAPLPQKIENIAMEVENTLNYIQDREKEKIDSLWVRFGIIDPGGEILSLLKERLSFPLKGVDFLMSPELSFREKQVLSPLVGKIL